MTWKMRLLVFSILLSSTYAAAPLYEGASCTMKSGTPGLCTLLINCSTVIDELKDGNPPEILCGYSGFEAIVCCPHSEAENVTISHGVEVEEESSQVNRVYISKKKCEEYAKSVFVLQPPILLGDNRWMNHSQCGIRQILRSNIQRKADPTEFPHVAAIGYESETGEIHWECSGTLISDEFVLTAGVCGFSSRGNATWIRLGTLHLVQNDDGANPVDRRISHVIIHPDYRPPKAYHDIALLRLETRVTFGGWIRPVCLHTALRPNNKKATVIGWGSRAGDDDVTTGGVLSTVSVPLVDQETCDAKYDSFGFKASTNPEGVIEDWSLCAKPSEKGDCLSEIGGGLTLYSQKQYCMYEIIGVKSSLGSCGQHYPRLYSRVARYVPWIESIAWKEE